MNKFIILVIFLLSLNVFSREGSFVGNGTGYAEILFNEEYNQLKKCLRKLSTDDKKYFTQNDLNQLSLIKNHQSQIGKLFIFRNNLDNFFNILGEEKVAVTSLNSEHPIYINTDLILFTSGLLKVSQKEILSIITHEVGHQVGIRDHDYLSTLGSKTAKVCLGRTFQKKNIFYSVSANEGIYSHHIYKSYRTARDLNDFYLFLSKQSYKVSILKQLRASLHQCPEREYLFIDDINITPNFSTIEISSSREEYDFLLTVRKSCNKAYTSVDNQISTLPTSSKLELLRLTLDIKTTQKGLSLRKSSITRWISP